MSEAAQFWADPKVIYPVAAAAAGLLLATIWLFRRRNRSGRQAAMIFLAVSVILHLALLWLVPLVARHRGSQSVSDDPAASSPGLDTIQLRTFDAAMEVQDQSAHGNESQFTPLPVASLADLTEHDPVAEPIETDSTVSATAQNAVREPSDAVDDSSSDQLAAQSAALQSTPTSLTSVEPEAVDVASLFDDLDSMLAAAHDRREPADTPSPADSMTDDSELAPEVANEPVDKNTSVVVAQSGKLPSSNSSAQPHDADQATSKPATVAGDLQSDFANRVGAAKQRALADTGGDAQTEAAVAAALKFLADTQRRDGAWDPIASGAGFERAPLGESRGGAGRRAETAITGLALLSLMGAGNTHLDGVYSDNVYRGLTYLIGRQQPDGSLAGGAALYAANYSHGMAALAMAEAAAITTDPSAVEAARRAVAHTQWMQHPTTGGFRYRRGDPGDLSQLGWQAMVLDGGHRAGITLHPNAVRGVQRFLLSVRRGAQGGLASYRPGEAPSRTMTAEALATRLLLGEQVPPAEIAEAELYMLQQPPGVGQDNYYYWYYATLAMHQLQDDAWRQWNAALKSRLLETQRADGSWPATTVWGGYGGTVYTTAMATLCLESYYRHAVRQQTGRIADLPGALQPR